MTTPPITSITDELIAELERANKSTSGQLYCNGDVWMGQGQASRCGSYWGSMIQCDKCKNLDSKRLLLAEISDLKQQLVAAGITAENCEMFRKDAERYLSALSSARYRIEQGRVWNGMGWTLTGLHPLNQQKAIDVIDAAMHK